MLASSTLASSYECLDPATGRHVAIKVIRPYLIENPSLADNFRNENLKIQRLEHPHVLGVSEISDQAPLWVAMDFLEQGSLKERVGARVTAGQAGKVITQIGAALHSCHTAGVLHLNLKPANILLANSGDYKLADFGMAGLAAGTYALIRASSSTPLPTYMSPEQALGTPTDSKSDVYSLGVLAYHLLTGSVPYQGNEPISVWAKQLNSELRNPQEFNHSLPVEVAAVVTKALEVDPAHRFNSAAQMTDAFLTAMSNSGVPLSDEPIPKFSSATAPVAAGPILSSRTSVGRERITTAGWASESPSSTNWLTPGQTGRLRRGGTLFAFAFAIAVSMIALVALGIDRDKLPVSSLSSVTDGEVWSSHQQNPTNTGYAPGQVPPLAGNIRWSFVTQSPILAAPAVADDIVYLATGDSRVLALGTTDGDILWEVRVATPVETTPVLAGNNLYVGLRNGEVLAMDRGSGEIVWTASAGGGIFGSPTVDRGKLFVGTGTGKVRAFDAITGEILWTFQTGNWVMSSPAVSENGVVVFGSRDRTVYVLEAKSGSTLLDYKVARSVEGSAAIVGDRAYIGNDSGAVFAIDLTARRKPLDDQIIWMRNQLYLWNMMDQVPKQRGAIWSLLTGRRQTIVSTPAVTDDLVVVNTREGNVYGFGRGIGDKRWKFEDTMGTNVTSPIIIGDTVFFSSTAGRILTINAMTGAVTWEWPLPKGEQPSTSPVVVGNTMYVGSAQDQPETLLFRQDPNAIVLKDQKITAENDWYYQYLDSNCSPGVKAPIGPFANRTDALLEARQNGRQCGVLYAVE